MIANFAAQPCDVAYCSGDAAVNAVVLITALILIILAGHALRRTFQDADLWQQQLEDDFKRLDEGQAAQRWWDNPPEEEHQK